MAGAVMLLLLIWAAVAARVAYVSESTRRATIAQAIAATSLVVSAGLLLFFVGPRFKELYIGFGVELPKVSVLIIKAVDNAIRVWFVFIPNLAAAAVVGTVLFWLNHRDEKTRKPARIWSAILNSSLVVLISLILLAILAPLPKLLNDLS